MPPLRFTGAFMSIFWLVILSYITAVSILFISRPVIAQNLNILACQGTHALDELAEYAEAVTGIEITVEEMPALAAIDRALSEDPEADALWGCPLLSFSPDLIAELFQPLSFEALDMLPSALKDDDNRWYAPMVDIGLMCVNQARLEMETGLSPNAIRIQEFLLENVPVTIAISRPERSQVGYLYMAFFDEILGEEQRDAFLGDSSTAEIFAVDRLEDVCRAVGEGAATVGLTSLMAAALFHVTLPIVPPEDGTWSHSYIAGLLITSDRRDEAEQFFQMSLEEEAQRIVAQSSHFVPASRLSEESVLIGEMNIPLIDKGRFELLERIHEFTELAGYTIPPLCNSRACEQCQTDWCRPCLHCPR